MKILFVNEKKGYFGGVEQNIADTVTGLRERGHSCYLAFGISTSNDSQGYERLFDGTFACRELGSEDTSARDFVPLVRDLESDVVYFHKTGSIDFGELPDGVRLVRMVHDHDLCCPRKHKYFAWSGRVCHHKAGWRCWADGAFVGRCSASRLGFQWVSIPEKIRQMRQNQHLDRLLVGSRFMREELLSNGFDPRKVHILPPVIRMRAVPHGEISREPRILFVGQLIRGKGVDLLLRSLAALSRPFELTIVGTGNSEPELRQLARELGLSDRVHFRGWVPHAEISRFYSDCRIVVVPSRWPEPFGMIGLEAMAHARPVVAFAVGGIPDWLEHEKTGLLVPEQDVESMGRALGTLLNDPDLCRGMGESGLSSLHEKFRFEDYLERTEAFLEN